MHRTRPWHIFALSNATHDVIRRKRQPVALARTQHTDIAGVHTRNVRELFQQFLALFRTGPHRLKRAEALDARADLVHGRRRSGLVCGVHNTKKDDNGRTEEVLTEECEVM